MSSHVESPYCGLVSINPAQPHRRRMSKQDRRAQLLVHAQAMFAAHGFHHISMDDIAEAAAVSKPILYRHFPSKLDLYLAIIDERSHALVQAVEAALHHHDAPSAPYVVDESSPLSPAAQTLGLQVVSSIMGAYVIFASETGMAASLLFESDVTRDDTVRERVEEPNTVIAHLVARRLRDLTDLSDADAFTVARCATALARHAAVDALHTATPYLDRDAHVDLLARFAWYGIQGMLRREGKTP